MSFQFCIENRGSQIPASCGNDFTDGDTLLCDPGNDFCDTRLFNLMDIKCTKNSTGFYMNVMSSNKWPDFGTGKYGIPRRANVRLYPYDETQLTYLDSFIITHIADPDGKRYCEAWVTYYPSAGYDLSLFSGDDILVTSDSVSMKPLVKPKVIQTIPLPAGSPTTDFITSSYYRGISIRSSGEMFVIYADAWICVYTWNGTTYDITWEHEFPDTVRGAFVTSIGGLVHAGGTIYWLTADPVWGIDETYVVSIVTGEGVMPSGSVMTDFKKFGQSQKPYTYSHDGTLLESPTSERWSAWPAARWAYTSSGMGIGWLNAQWSVLGGPPYWALTYGTSSHVDHDEDGEFNYSRAFFMFEFFYYTWITKDYKQFKYYSLDGSDLSLDSPSNNTTGGYVWTDYLVGWTYRVGYGTPTGAGIFYCHTPTEKHRLYDYDFNTHKIYTNPFYPVKSSPILYLVNDGLGNILVLEIKAAYYDQLSPVEGTFVVSTPAEITTTTNFTCPTQPAGTSLKFLISYDDVTYYKWNGATWVTEASIYNGNTQAEFITGCQSGFVPPVDKYAMYVKVAFYSTTEDDTPGFDWGTCKLSLTTISTANSSYLCDDSKIMIEHFSDTETKFTSLMGQNVIIAAQVCIIAPPYNVDYED